MTPALTFFIGLVLLVLFGWYFATDHGVRKRLLATLLMVLLVVFSIVTIWPPSKKIQLGLDIQGGTSFLIRLVRQGDQALTKTNLEQAVEVIRKRVDYFGGGEPVISPVGKDRILVQIPGLDPAKIMRRASSSRASRSSNFDSFIPITASALRAIDAGTEVIPPEYRIEIYKMQQGEGQEASEERLLVKKKADLGGDRVTESHADYGNEGWGVSLSSTAKAQRHSARSPRRMSAIVSRSCSTA